MLHAAIWRFSASRTRKLIILHHLRCAEAIQICKTFLSVFFETEKIYADLAVVIAFCSVRNLAMAFVQGVLGLVLVVVVAVTLAVAAVLAGAIGLALAVACGAAFLVAISVALAFGLFLARRRFRSARLA